MHVSNKRRLEDSACGDPIISSKRRSINSKDWSIQHQPGVQHIGTWRRQKVISRERVPLSFQNISPSFSQRLAEPAGEPLSSHIRSINERLLAGLQARHGWHFPSLEDLRVQLVRYQRFLAHANPSSSQRFKSLSIEDNYFFIIPASGRHKAGVWLTRMRKYRPHYPPCERLDPNCTVPPNLFTPWRVLNLTPAVRRPRVVRRLVRTKPVICGIPVIDGTPVSGVPVIRQIPDRRKPRSRLTPVSRRPPVTVTFGRWSELPIELKEQVLGHLVTSPVPLGEGDDKKFFRLNVKPLMMTKNREFATAAKRVFFRENTFVFIFAKPVNTKLCQLWVPSPFASGSLLRRVQLLIRWPKSFAVLFPLKKPTKFQPDYVNQYATEIDWMNKHPFLYHLHLCVKIELWKHDESTRRGWCLARRVYLSRKLLEKTEVKVKVKKVSVEIDLVLVNPVWTRGLTRIKPQPCTCGCFEDMKELFLSKFPTAQKVDIA